jgi:hypothetical protein
MNSRAANSGGSAGPVPPPPPIEFFLVLPDGSCTPATSKTCKIVMKQARSEARKQAKIKRHEKAIELQMALEDRAAARRLLQELAEIERDRIRYAARFKVRVRPEKPGTLTSPVTKRLTLTPMKAPRTPSQRPASSWVIDDFGMRGIIWQQSYLGRKSPNFYRGAARDSWEYDVRDEAVLLDAAGEPIIISSMGDDWVEIGAAWQAMEDASTRKNAKIQIRAIAPFDSDMGQDEMVAALKHFCETILEPLGLPYSAVIHAPPVHGDERNFHPHLAFSLRPMRRVEAYCWDVADEVRGEFDGKDGVQMLRHLWAHSMSEAAEQARRNMRYTGLGYGARGLDLEAGTHLGEGRSAIVARGGHVWSHERNRIRNARNAARRAIRDADHKIAALTKVRDTALARMAAERGDASPGRKRVVAERPQVPVVRRVANVSVGPVLRYVPSVDAAPVRRIGVPEPSVAPRSVAMSTIASAAIPRQASRAVDRQPASSRVSAFEPLIGSVGLIASRPANIAPTALTASIRPPVELSPRRSATYKLDDPSNRNVSRLSSAAPAVLSAWQGVGRGPGLARAPSASVAARPAKRLQLAIRSEQRPDPILAQVEAMLLAIRQLIERQRQRARATSVRKDWQETNTEQHVAQAPMPAVAYPEPLAAPTPLSSAQPDMAGSVAQPPAVQAARWRAGRIAVQKNPSAPAPVLPSRKWFERNPGQTWSEQAANAEALDRRRLAHIERIDPYVVDLRDGSFDIAPAAMAATGVTSDWVQQFDVQQGLAMIRSRQQTLVSALAAEAERRPLAFVRHGARFWPRDLALAQLARLDRWSQDEGFQNDVHEIAQAVRTAHDRSDKERRAREVARPAASRVAPTKPFKPIADGFGGMRDTPPPVFRFEDVGVRAAAFDKATGHPSKSLLMLLRYCGEHPHNIAFAADGRLTGENVPKLIDPLIRMWRHDDRIQALVVETVSASRKAGRAVWPPQHAAAIRALLPAAEPRWTPPSDRDLSLSR